MIIAYPLAFIYGLPQIFTRKHFFFFQNIRIKINCIEYTTGYKYIHGVILIHREDKGSTANG